MAKEDTAKKEVPFSDPLSFNGLEGEAKALQQALNQLEEENKFIRTTLNKVEEETTMLRELFNKATVELTNIKKPALLVAEVLSMMEDKAIIRLPNGNKFYCYISKEVKDLRSGDSVLVDQKSLNIMDRVDLGEN